MKIGILEDNDLQARRLVNILRQLVDLDSQLFVTDQPQKLLAFARQNPRALFFIDFEIRGMVEAGLKTAQLILKVSPQAKFILLSTHTELSMRAFSYQIQALDFIDKRSDPDVMVTQIKENLNLYRTSFDNGQLMIGDYQMNEQDIIYAQTVPNTHDIKVVTIKEVYLVRYKMSELASLDEHLLQIHTSYLINTRYIFEITSTSITLTNHLSLPISRKYKKEIKALAYP